MDPQERPRRSSQDRQPHFMKQWRLAAGLTLRQMAEAIKERRGDEITLPQLSRIENGIRPYNQDTLEAYAEVLGCTPADLLSRTPYDPDEFYRLIVQTAEAYFGRKPKKPKPKTKTKSKLKQSR